MEFANASAAMSCAKILDSRQPFEPTTLRYTAREVRKNFNKNISLSITNGRDLFTKVDARLLWSEIQVYRKSNRDEITLNWGAVDQSFLPPAAEMVVDRITRRIGHILQASFPEAQLHLKPNSQLRWIDEKTPGTRAVRPHADGGRFTAILALEGPGPDLLGTVRILDPHKETFEFLNTRMISAPEGSLTIMTNKYWRGPLGDKEPLPELHRTPPGFAGRRLLVLIDFD